MPLEISSQLAKVSFVIDLGTYEDGSSVEVTARNTATGYQCGSDHLNSIEASTITGDIHLAVTKLEDGTWQAEGLLVPGTAPDIAITYGGKTERQMKLLRTLVFASVWLALWSWGAVGRFSASEAATIGAEPGEGAMRVLKTTDGGDSLRLRGRSGRIGRAWPGDPLYARLKRRMLCTVIDPADPGVGIAAPQVGVSRRLIAVQRFDREGEPFEFYVNPRIVRYAGGTVRSPEGCLSIPGKIDTAVRRERVVLRYRDGQSGKRRRESVSGFTAVVFQHEIDHWDGILFIDRTPDRAAGNRRHKSSKP